MESSSAKQTYRPQHKLEVFFTGGVARITRDGKLLACSCGEEVKIVDVATGSVTRTLSGDSEPVTALAVSPDNKTLIVASRSLACRVYDLTTGELRRSWRAHKAPVADITVDASGGYIATASADRSIKVWDLQGGFCTHSFTGHSGVVLRVLFHPKQLQLFSGGDDSEVRVWDLVEKKCVATFKSHFSAVTSLALSADGWVLLSGGRDKVVTAWDLRKHVKLATVPVFESVEGVVSLPPGAPFPGIPAASDPDLMTKKGAARPVFFATAGEKGRIKIWRSDTAACVYEDVGLGQASSTSSSAGGSAAQEYTDLVLVPGGQQILATTADARLLFYKCDKGDTQLSIARQLIGNVDEVTDVRLVGGSKEQPTHLAVATNCEVIHLFDLQGMSCVTSCVGHTDTVLCLDAAFSAPAPTAPQGSGVLVSGGKDNEVRVWDVPSGRCLARGVGHVGSVSAVALARKQPNKFMVSAGADKLLKVWDLAAALEAALNPTTDPAEGAPAPKKAKKGVGKAVPAAAASVGGVVQMRVMAATAAHDKDINSVVVSPNDMLVATGSQDRTARVWKLPALTPHLVLRGHKRGVWQVEFSPVDQALLTASGDKTIKMWSLAGGGACIRTFEGHQASVLRATFVTAGTQIVSAGADGLVKLWSLKSDECVNTFDEHQGKIWAMNTGGPSESTLVTGGSDACVCVWSDVTASDAQAAEEAAEVLVGKEQDLANALADGDFVAAAKLAFELRHPGRLLAVVQRAAAAAAGVQPLLLGPASQAVAAGQHVHTLLGQLVRHMNDEDVRVALEYCREWNTHSKHCHAAQAMLHALLKHKKPAKLLALPGIGELLDGMLAYSGRHYARIDRLLRSTRLLDYSLAAMKVFSPEGVQDLEEQQQQHADVAVALLGQVSTHQPSRTAIAGQPLAVGEKNPAGGTHAPYVAKMNGTVKPLLANGSSAGGSSSSSDDEDSSQLSDDSPDAQLVDGDVNMGTEDDSEPASSDELDGGDSEGDGEGEGEGEESGSGEEGASGGVVNGHGSGFQGGEDEDSFLSSSSDEEGEEEGKGERPQQRPGHAGSKVASRNGGMLNSKQVSTPVAAGQGRRAAPYSQQKKAGTAAAQQTPQPAAAARGTPGAVGSRSAKRSGAKRKQN